MDTLKLYQSNIVNGLSSWSYTVVNAGWYKIDADATINPGSALVITINQNGSPLATNDTPSPLSINTNVQANCYAAAGDVLSIVTTSSSITDLMPQSVKMIIVVNND